MKLYFEKQPKHSMITTQQASQTIYNNKPLPNLKLIEHPSGTAKLAFERIVHYIHTQQNVFYIHYVYTYR